MVGLSGKVEWPAKKACLLTSNNSTEFLEKEKKNTGKKMVYSNNFVNCNSYILK